jgi:hypothetical protein
VNFTVRWTYAAFGLNGVLGGAVPVSHVICGASNIYVEHFLELLRDWLPCMCGLCWGANQTVCV